MRSLAARGDVVAKVVRAKLRGVREDLEKSIDEKETPPLETSGTPERVVVEVSQVMEDWICWTEVSVSAGRAVAPIMKHGFAARRTLSVGAEVC